MSQPDPGTLLDYLKRTADYFREHDIPEPRLNAERLLCGVLGLRRIDLYLQFDRTLTSDEVAKYREMIRRRAKGEPLQYILGTTEFYGREFIVTPDVLIPRPETEVLVDAVLKRLAGVEHPVVADIGTGSGCIALTIAAERPDARVVAADISEAALAVARRNAEKLGLASRVEFRAGDLLEPLGDLQVHALVSNPPYVAETEREMLPREVRDWEPHVALVSGAEGLSLIHRLVEGAPRVVLPGGFAALEIGMGQADAVRAVWHAAAPTWPVEVLPDLAGIDRIAIAARPAA